MRQPTLFALLFALLLVLPAQCVALQKSFQPIASLLQIAHNPFEGKAAAHARLIAKSVPPKPLDKQWALQLSADHPELTPIYELLDSIVVQLDAQDQFDTTLLNAKTGNHTSAVAVTTQVNATLTQKTADYEAALTTCNDKQQNLPSQRSSHDKEVLACDSELNFIDTMKGSYDKLNAVGSESLGSMSFVQTTAQTLNELADKITSASPEDKAPFKQVNLIGRHYGTDSDNLLAAIQNLEQKIIAKKTTAQNEIQQLIASKDEACALSDQKQSDVVVWQLRQNTAIVSEQAAMEDLTTTNSMVTASRQETTSLRATIAEIRQKIQELAALPTTEAIQKMPMSMLQMHMTKFEDVVESIKTHLQAMHDRIDSEATAETSAKEVKRDTWVSAKDTYNEHVETAAVLSDSLTNLHTRLAEATGSLNEVNDRLQDEIESQLRESAMFSEIRTLLASLQSSGTETNALATHVSKQMLALAIGAERSHEEVLTRFEKLISLLESEMMQKKNELQASYNEALGQRTTLSTSVAEKQTEDQAANTAKLEAEAAMEAALLEYETASETLDNNNVIRAAERELINRLLDMVEGLKSA